MKIVANKLNDELRDEIIRYVGDWIANLPAGAKVEVDLSRSYDPFDLADEQTLQIRVRSGAKDAAKGEGKPL